MITLRLRLPESLYARLSEVATREGVSINQMIASAVAEKMAALMTEEYLAERAKRGSRKRFDKALSQVADIEPDDVDRLSTVHLARPGDRLRRSSASGR